MVTVKSRIHESCSLSSAKFLKAYNYKTCLNNHIQKDITLNAKNLNA